MKNRITFKLKSSIALLISFLMIATLTSTSVFVSYAVSVDAVFADVSKTDWFYDNVQYVYDNSIMNGVDTDKFAPNSPLSRAMGVTILYRAAGEPSIDGAKQIPFDDVERNQWYTNAVLWAYDSGIVNGRAVNEFATNANITRAELATILLRYADHEKLELPETKDGKFTDEDEIPEFAKEAVDALYKAGIVNGKEGNNFDPSASVTRAETAAMIHRFIETAKKPTDTPDDPQDTPDDPQDTPDYPQDTPYDQQNPPKDDPQDTPDDPPVDEPEDDLMSRGTAVDILYRAAGEPESLRYGRYGAVEPFRDVQTGIHWYANAVIWAYDYGIADGRSEDKFEPKKPVTRAEYAVMLVRYARYEELDLPETRSGSFADTDEIPDYAKDAANTLYKAEIIDGDRLDPSAGITQEEAEEMLERMMEKAVKSTDPDILTVLFYGSSYTYTGNTPLHFQHIANRQVNTIFWSIYDRDFIFSLDEIRDKIDIVVEQLDGPNPFVMNDGFYWFRNVVGSDKTYYAFNLHIGPSEDGSEWAAYVGQKFSRIKNEDLEKYRKELADIGTTYVALGGVVPYNSELREDDFFVFDTEIHPKELMGYCTALAMYCEMFDVKATDQNNGALRPKDIPGNTQEEKDAYMVEVKKTVQHILDIQ